MGDISLGKWRNDTEGCAGRDQVTLGPRTVISISPFYAETINGHFFSACSDNIRLWNAAEAGEGEAKGRMQFKIIPGHHGGMVSQMCESTEKLHIGREF